MLKTGGGSSVAIRHTDPNAALTELVCKVYFEAAPVVLLARSTYSFDSRVE
jgi:hypothetical protein